MDWSLLGCGTYGHVTYAPDEAPLRAQLNAEAAGQQCWRCLRCGTFVPGPPQQSGPAEQAPAVRRGAELRSLVILRLFAVERLLRVVVFGLLAVGVWLYKDSRLSIDKAFTTKLPVVRDLLLQLGINIKNSKIVGLIQRALAVSPHALTYLAIGLAAYAVIELVEAVGLWLGKRWGEYFAMVATSLGLPFEIYELTGKITVFRLVLFAINLGLVLYLVLAKRLFGVRGGKKAYEAKRRADSVIQEAAAAAEAATAQRARYGC